MTEKAKDKPAVKKHYDAVARDYHTQYDKKHLYDTSKPYLANYFRMNLLLRSFAEKKVKKVVEIGVGEGTPLRELAKTGVETWGCDISEKMAAQARKNFKDNGLPADRISSGDIQDPASYAALLEHGPFDGLMAMGVMPHVKDDDAVIENMSSFLRPGGSVFIEFRNVLFSLFTFNRHTYDFILNDLLKNIDPKLKAAIAGDLKDRLRMDLPVSRDKVEDGGAPGFDAILSRFHNPFEMTELFKRHKFTNIKTLWYHYHPAMPYLEKQNAEIFRKEAVSLEGESSDWRSWLLCSAFVIEAVKGEN